MKWFREAILDAFATIGYPTVRELLEFLRMRNAAFGSWQYQQVYSQLHRLNFRNLESFLTGLGMANRRYFISLPAPLRRLPSILFDEELAMKIERKVRNGAAGQFDLNGTRVVRDPYRPASYVIGPYGLDGVYDHRKQRFRLPTIRFRFVPPESSFGDGWSETWFASSLFYGNDHAFLRVRVC